MYARALDWLRQWHYNFVNLEQKRYIFVLCAGLVYDYDHVYFEYCLKLGVPLFRLWLEQQGLRRYPRNLIRIIPAKGSNIGLQI